MKRKVIIATKCNDACSGNQPQPQGTELSKCTDYALSPSRTNMKNDSKLCKQLHKFTVKKVTAIQKLNTHCC